MLQGFGPAGGSRDQKREDLGDPSEFAQALRLSWLPKVTEGFLVRRRELLPDSQRVHGRGV